MSDGVKIRYPNKEQIFARLRKISPNVDAEIAKSNERFARQFVSQIKNLAPDDSGKLKQSLRYGFVDPETKTEVASAQIRSRGAGGTRTALGIFGEFYWKFIEFGTVNTAARPFIYPIYRLMKTKYLRTARAAINRAVKSAVKK